MLQQNLLIGYNIDYTKGKGLQVTEEVAEVLKYSSTEINFKEKVYICDEYVAYCDIRVKRNAVDKNYTVEVSNIRRKEYFDDPIPGSELSTAINGIKHIKEHADYIKSCGNEVDRSNHPFTGDFI